MSGREFSDDDPFSQDGGPLPELDLDPLSAPQQSTYDPASEGGDMLDDPLGDMGGLDPLELDTAAISPAAPAAASTPPSSTSSTPPAQRSLQPPREEPTEEAAPELPPEEVAAIADYGSAPESPVMWVPYAALVLSRWIALRKELDGLRGLRASAAKDAKDALVELGRALHAHGAEALPPLAAVFARADQTGAEAGQKTDEWEKSRQTAETQRGSLEAKIAEAEGRVGPYRDRETKLATQMDTRENELRRAKARLSRVEIELRNLAQAETVDEAKKGMLEAERDARRAETEKAQGHVDELTPQLSAARKELTVMLDAVNDLETQRRAIDEAQSRKEKLHLTSAGEAEGRYHGIIEELAKTALDRNLAAAVEPAKTKAAEMMRSTLASREREIALHEAALDAYDAGSFQKGLALLGAAGLLILAMIVFVIVR